MSSPIILVGTHRSGTTMLGEALGAHPQIAYWNEPRHVWMWGHNYRPDDFLSERDATPRIARHIRSEFGRFLADSGRSVFAEKTPSNCLRLPFVEAVFPEARYVHIYRDGRAVIRSTLQMVSERGPDKVWWIRRLQGTPVWEWPAMLGRAYATVGQRILGREMLYWGPRPPGWRTWLRSEPRLRVLAHQWRSTIRPVLDFRRSVPQPRWLDVRYEDFVTDPIRHMREILAFVGLDSDPAQEEHLRREVDGLRIDAWQRSFGERELAEIESLIHCELKELGYEPCSPQ